MQLLGPYTSKLSAYTYQQLVTILQQAIAAGEYGGGSLFNSASAAALQAEATSFANMPIPSAGDRAMADQVDNPINLLIARYNAITNEVSDFQTQLNNLLSILYKDSELVVQTLNASIGNSWVTRQPQITGAIQFSWDFSAGYGYVTYDIPYTDPKNGVIYDSPLPVSTFFNGTLISGGLSVPSKITQIAVKNLTWIYSFKGQTETASGSDWTELSLLASSPLLAYGVVPTMTTLLPSGGNASPYFTATGQCTAGNLPIYVQISFIERMRVATIGPLTENVPVTLTPYTISIGDTVVYNSNKVFTIETDYELNGNGQLTPLNSLNGQTVSVLIGEFYPAYQCSIDQATWSNPVMLDGSRPYPDITTTFVPVNLVQTKSGTLFPLTDENGVPLGLYIQMIGAPSQEMEFSVISSVAPNYGAKAELDVEFENPGYMTGLNLGPFTNFPMTLNSVVIIGFSDANPITLPISATYLNQEMTVTFPLQLVRKVKLAFTQENYSLKEYQVTPPDALRRDTLANLQSVLPFAVRRTQPPPPVFLEGAEYDFGVEDLYGVVSKPDLPGIFVVGPFIVNGLPEVLRLDAQTTGDVDIYLYYDSLDVNGNILSNDSWGLVFPAGTSIVYPSNDPAIASAKLYLKFVLRSANAMINRYLLQVTLA
jgi:hypothetical protein